MAAEPYYEANIVIGRLTSSLIDLMLLNKRTIFVPYCHYFNNKFNDILPKHYLARNFDDFKKILNKNIKDAHYNEKTIFQENFYKEFINYDNKDIFEKYNELLL